MKRLIAGLFVLLLALPAWGDGFSPRQTVATNLLLRSQEFDNASWTKSAGSISANAVAAPDLTTTADQFIEDTAGGTSHGLIQAATITAGATVTGSLYVKANGRTAVYIQIYDGSADWFAGWFNLTTGAYSGEHVGGGGDLTGQSIEALADDWYRISVTGTLGAGDTTAEMRPGVSAGYNAGDVGASFNYTGDGASGLYLWGAMLNEGALSSYVVTTTATVTRAEPAHIGGDGFR